MTYQRKEIIGNATLYLGDCRDILPTLPKVDAVITDPPYGQAYVAPSPSRRTKGGLSSAPPTERHTPDRIAGDDKPFDPTHLLEYGTKQIIWGAHKFADRLPPGSWLLWDKKPDGTRNDFGDGEAAWFSGRQPLRIYRHLWNGLAVQSGSAEAAKQPGTGAQVRRLHPTQKPIAVMEWCLGFVPWARDITDPYMGSGTTGVACMNMGRKFIGIEIDPAYFDIACKRIENSQRQERLFA